MQDIMVLDENGLTVTETYSAIQSIVQSALLAYNPALVFDDQNPNSAIANIVSDLTLLNQSIIQNIYSNLTLANSTGIALDNLAYTLCGLKRKTGSQTIINIAIVTTSACALSGGEFKVQDSAGNIFILQATQTITTAGTYTFSFICSSVGATNPSIGSITQISTPIQGVASVTNNATASVVGTDYETDAQLRIRIAVSRSFNSRDQLSSIKSRLLAINGVTYAYVDHNRTDITNSIGILPHSVACVVEGGLQSDIANAIALYSAPIGIATQGDITYTITKSNGRTEIVSYSQTTITLCQVYISIYKDGGYANFDFIAESLASNLFFDIGQIISNDAIIKYVKSITNSDFIINTVQVAIDDETPIFLDRIIPTDYKTRFILQTSKITIV